MQNRFTVSIGIKMLLEFCLISHLSQSSLFSRISPQNAINNKEFSPVKINLRLKQLKAKNQFFADIISEKLI